MYASASACRRSAGPHQRRRSRLRRRPDLLQSHPSDGGQNRRLLPVDVRSLVTDAHGFCHAPEAEAFGWFIHQHPEGGSKELLIEARADSGTAHRWSH